MFTNLFNEFYDNFSDIVETANYNYSNFSETENELNNPSENKKLINYNEHLLFNTDIESNDVCPICFEDFCEGDIASILPCYHIFHKNCIEPWIKKANNCPTCRIDNCNLNKKLYLEKIKKKTKENMENIFFGKNTSINLNLIDNLSIKKLKFLLDEFKIDYSYCIQKNELKDLVFNEIFMINKNIDEIKKFIKKNKVDYSGCLEKKDLLKLVASIQLIKRLQ